MITCGSNRRLTTNKNFKRRLHPLVHPVTNFINFSIISLLLSKVNAFLPPPPPPSSSRNAFITTSSPPTTTLTTPTTPTPTSLHVWFFGGSESQTTTSGDQCELVAVKIERTSPNSRRISGEITVPVPTNDVWAILTDYDNLSTHVPNLVESRRIRGYGSARGSAAQGDGRYRCRLYQKGAQKIVGFEFGADVTMDMREGANEERGERMIGFKCVDSLFFSEFDGEWKVAPEEGTNGGSSVVSYVVDVRPKGPVPVMALEWRIREDVPTNLRAVKDSAMTLGEKGVLAMRRRSTSAVMRALPTKPKESSSSSSEGERKNGVERNGFKRNNGAGETNVLQPVAKKERVERLKALATKSQDNFNDDSPSDGKNGRSTQVPIVQWGDDETMGAYLRD